MICIVGGLSLNKSCQREDSLWVPVEADPDEVLGHVRDALEELLGKVDLEVGRGDVAQRLLVGGNKGMKLKININIRLANIKLNLVCVAAEGGESGEEDVGEHAQAPDVRRQRDRLQAENLGRCKSTIKC